MNEKKVRRNWNSYKNEIFNFRWKKGQVLNNLEAIKQEFQ